MAFAPNRHLETSRGRLVSTTGCARAPFRYAPRSHRAPNEVTVALRNFKPAYEADIEACPRNVRFTPESGHQLSARRCPLCAKSGHMQCSKF